MRGLLGAIFSGNYGAGCWFFMIGLIVRARSDMEAGMIVSPLWILCCGSYDA